MSDYNQIHFQLVQAYKAFNADPSPRLASAIKQLQAARKKEFSPARLKFNACDVKIKEMAHHKLGLSYTASGYGSKIPTRYMVLLGGVWRRVYCAIYSNNGSTYICCNDGKYFVNFETN